MRSVCLARLLCALIACIFTLTACPMNTPVSSLPRNMALKAFDPHRTSFGCKYESNEVPPIDSEAEAWFQEGLRVTSRDLWPNERNYPQAVELWQKAAERKHWKAMMNLAGVLIEGDGTESFVVRPDPERAVRIVEEAMKLGIPAAFDAMGTYHRKGLGVKPDASRAYAFWELAADMGSPSAQTYLGQAFLAAYDNPKSGFWSNRSIGMQMLQCAYAQDSGEAAYELGLEYRAKRDFGKAIEILHQGTRLGSESCANSLSVMFNGAYVEKGGPSVDEARSQRYSAIGNALYLNPDLRFPNLDKVLPLPPAKLPQWDMSKPRTLIDAAKGIIPTPPPKPTPGSQRTGRAHIPQGYGLPFESPYPAFDAESMERAIPEAQAHAVPHTGYWLAQLNQRVREYQRDWNNAQLPLRYEKGEAFEALNKRSLGEPGQYLSARWFFLGEARQLPAPAPPPEVARGVARLSQWPAWAQRCRGARPCPRTGVWIGRISSEHALAKVFNRFERQAYVQEGQPFPDPKALHLDIAAHEVHWWWADNANQPGPAGIRLITLTDRHDDQGRPLA